LSEVGGLLGVLAGLASFPGVMFGVVFGPRVVRRDRRWELWWPGAVYLTIVPTWMLTLYISDLYLVGTGAGPLLVGYLSDVLTPTLGGGSLRYAMIIGVMFISWGAFHFFIAAKHLRNELVS
jgi:hypothetical protein